MFAIYILINVINPFVTSSPIFCGCGRISLHFVLCLDLSQLQVMDLTPAEPPSINDQSTVLSSSDSRGFSVSSSSNGSSQVHSIPGKSSSEPAAQQFQQSIIQLLRLYLKYLDKHPVATKAVTRCYTALIKKKKSVINVKC